ncbi:hypothetical protein VTJ04DRAFT_1074 [Mycothermus thermophilus]|uniref:uncharacterized protein n=1 Tax=Humicola insolens TaxID=85995 RepID=UPI003744927C
MEDFLSMGGFQPLEDVQQMVDIQMMEELRRRGDAQLAKEVQLTDNNQPPHEVLGISPSPGPTRDALSQQPPSLSDYEQPPSLAIISDGPSQVDTTEDRRDMTSQDMVNLDPNEAWLRYEQFIQEIHHDDILDKIHWTYHGD